MDAQLVGPPSPRARSEPSPSVGGAADTVVCGCPLPVGINDHAPAAASIELSKSGLDPSREFGWAILNDGPIDFLHRPAGEQRAQPPQRLRVPPQHQTAAGVAIETVRERRRVRQAEAQLVELAFEIGTAAGAGMHGNPGRLVDDDDQTVAIKDAVGELPPTPTLSRKRGFVRE